MRIFDKGGVNRRSEAGILHDEEFMEFQVAHKRKYSRQHIWYQDKDDRFTIGVSDFLQADKGDVLRVILPHADTEVDVDDELFSVSFADQLLVFRSPFSGRLVEVNGEIEINPELINDDPYGDGWCVILEPHPPYDTDNLLEPDEYVEFIEDEM